MNFNSLEGMKEQIIRYDLTVDAVLGQLNLMFMQANPPHAMSKNRRESFTKEVLILANMAHEAIQDMKVVQDMIIEREAQSKEFEKQQADAQFALSEGNLERQRQHMIKNHTDTFSGPWVNPEPFMSFPGGVRLCKCRNYGKALRKEAMQDENDSE